MKRLELGRLSADGELGLRISAPGHDVADPEARLLFDTNTPVVSALMRTAIAAAFTRAVTQTTPPYGLPGAVTTYFDSTARWDFPTPLPFAPLCMVGFTSNVGGSQRSYDANMIASALIRYESHSTHIITYVRDAHAGDVNYAASPIHRITVLNVPRPL